MKQDLRVQKTQKAVKNALFSLLRFESFDKISISAICSKAEINRVTFYKHYKDKFELANELVNDIVGDALAKASDEQEDFSSPEKIIEFCIKLVGVAVTKCFDYKKILIMLLREENSFMSYMLFTSTKKSLGERLIKLNELKPLKNNPEILAVFLCGGISNAVYDWLNGLYGDINKDDFIKIIQNNVSILLNSPELYR